MHRLSYTGAIVVFKMGRRQGGPGLELAVGGRISESIRNRRATQPQAHFQKLYRNLASALLR